MTDAGVFGYVTEAAAANEYWFDRDHENLPAAYGPAGKLACIVGGSNIEYQTFFGNNPIYIHAIQYIPVLPSSYYLVQNDKFAEAQTEFDYLRTRSVSSGFGDIGSWGDEWNNLALQYASLFNPDWAAANQSALGNDAGQAGLSYYTLHSNRALGRRSFDYHIGATNSGVFYNPYNNQFTYCAYNPTNTRQTYNVYRNTAIIGVITVAANSSFSTHVLGSSSNARPTVNITAPTNGTVVAAPATITISATAADTDGTVTQVAFYDDATLLGIDTTAPYSFIWTGATAGRHTLTAQATDNGGQTGTSLAVSLTVTGVACTGTVPNGDYRYEVATTGGTVNWTFIPQAPITGSTLAIIYIRSGSGTGAYVGVVMTAQSGNFVFSQPRAAGAVLSFYFTYRIGATLTERNSSATPHTYTVGDVCATPTGTRTAAALTLATYPNPVQRQLVVEAAGEVPQQFTISNLLGAVLLRQPATGGSTTRLDVSALPAGVYLLTMQSASGSIVRRFTKE